MFEGRGVRENTQRITESVIRHCVTLDGTFTAPGSVLSAVPHVQNTRLPWALKSAVLEAIPW